LFVPRQLSGQDAAGSGPVPEKFHQRPPTPSWSPL
jgi:hypothetical protein